MLTGFSLCLPVSLKPGGGRAFRHNFDLGSKIFLGQRVELSPPNAFSVKVMKMSRDSSPHLAEICAWAHSSHWVCEQHRVSKRSSRVVTLAMRSMPATYRPMQVSLYSCDSSTLSLMHGECWRKPMGLVREKKKRMKKEGKRLTTRD